MTLIEIPRSGLASKVFDRTARSIVEDSVLCEEYNDTIKYHIPEFEFDLLYYSKLNIECELNKFHL